MDHAEFARLKREGRAGLQMEDSVARSFVEEHPRMPGRYRSAHTFWAWVWMITAVNQLRPDPSALRTSARHQRVCARVRSRLC
jgi:hypothetical protein